MASSVDVDGTLAAAGQRPEWVPWLRMGCRVAARVGKTTARAFGGPRHRPDGELEAYVNRILLLGPIDAGRQALVTAAIFYDRATDRNGGAQRGNVRRLFASAYLIAAKLHVDCPIPMSQYANLVGVTPRELLEMEIVFLRDLLAFDVRVDKRDFYLMARALGWDGTLE